MKTREEIARFMESEFDPFPPIPEKHGASHYGKCDLRRLMDFIFDGPPTSKAEEVFEPMRLRVAGLMRHNTALTGAEGIRVECTVMQED